MTVIMRFEWFQCFELLSLLLAIVCRKGLKRFSLTLFLPLLVLINLFEFAGVNYEGQNHFIYTLLIIVKTPFYLFLYSKMLMLRENELTAFRIICALCLFFILFNYFFWEGMETFNTYSFILTEIMNIVLSCLVLLRLYTMDADNVVLFREPYFWIGAANMLFGLAMLVFLGLLKYIQLHSIQIGNKTLYVVFAPIASSVLYLLYSYAFILCRKRTAN
jgi:hypothetical protein